MTPARIQEFAGQDDAGLAAFRALDRDDSSGARTPPGDATLLVAGRGGEPLARASLQVVEGMAKAPGRTGVIGHYEARDGAAGVTLLREALARLADRDVARVVGPMNGTTWDRYRLALPARGPADPAPFLSEPVNPPEYPDHFEEAGLDVVEWYVSQLVSDPDALSDRIRDAARRLADRGFRIEPLDPDRFDETLVELHRLSLDAFADNPYFSPISLDRFREIYAPVREIVDPELILMARNQAGLALGFSFGFPDLLDPSDRPSRYVLKTLAVAPAGRGMGLGSLLVHETHARARARGYRATIHALMHVGNDSLKISSHGGTVFRHYALYGWTP